MEATEPFLRSACASKGTRRRRNKEKQSFQDTCKLNEIQLESGIPMNSREHTDRKLGAKV